MHNEKISRDVERFFVCLGMMGVDWMAGGKSRVNCAIDGVLAYLRAD